MLKADLDRLKRPATLIAVFSALLVGFDLFILLLNTLGFDVSVLNQPSTVLRFGRRVRVPGLGLHGFLLFGVNAALLVGHAVLLGLALRLRLAPSRGRALITAVYSLLPCNFSCFLFPVSLWLLVAMRGGRLSEK